MKHSLLAGLILFLIVQSSLLHAQTDTEFWFVAPEITESHCSAGTCPGGEPVYFRVSALDVDAEVRIYQPANPSGLDSTFTVPAKSSLSFDASPWINDLENKPGNIILNKGVHIISNTLITVYYDEDEYWNQDIFSLKGKNALGMEFYTPFNSLWANGNYNPIKPYSSIDIVATEDNTIIDITPTSAIVGHPAGVTFQITLDKGETYSCLANSQSAAGHLGGTHIVSNKAIAVTIKDDSVAGDRCRDLIGDQTVPIINSNGKRIVGYEYIVMRGKINMIDPNASPQDPDGIPTGEIIFIMATEANTEVYIDGVSFGTLANPGEQTVYELRNNSTHVEGDKPIMVLHASGFGCEMGGAILPSIDGCSGSLEVSFTRSTDRDFYLNIMTFDAAKDAFTMHYEDGSTFPIPGTWFEPVGATDYVCLKKDTKYFANNTGGGVPQGEVVKITNSVTVFHLGLIEGGTTTGCKYGYLSEYSAYRGDVRIVESGSKSAMRCFGDTFQLSASGGISYSWSPSSYLDDPHIASPIAAPPPGIYNYSVTINRGCFADTTITVIVGIAPEVEAFFEVDKSDICAPDMVTFYNQSIGVDLSDERFTQWDFDLQDPDNDLVFDTSPEMQHSYTNTTDSVVTKTVQLIVWNEQGCNSEFRRDILIRPEIHAGFTKDVSEGCQSVTVNFTNTSTGNTDRYKWDLGDGGSANTPNVSHTYQNLGMEDNTYHVEMVAISPFYCSDTAETDISVYPYLEADFALDVFEGCSPLMINISNNSAGYIEEYEWDYGDGTTSTTSAPSHTHTYENKTALPVTYNMRLVVRNITRGCSDTLNRAITIYPEIRSDFVSDVSDGCHPLEVLFTNQSSVIATQFLWDFGDGSTSDLRDPVHTFSNMGVNESIYEVKLIASGDHGECGDTTMLSITVLPPSVGGTLTGGTASITYKESTGLLTLSGQGGKIRKWQRMLDANPWEDLLTTSSSYAEIPISAGVWRYRVEVKNGSCEEAYSDPLTITVLQREIFISPEPGQGKTSGEEDPVFTYTNSEWNDSTRFTGALGREPGEEPGFYAYTLGDLSAGPNYSQILDPEPGFTISAPVGMGQDLDNSDLKMICYSTPISTSPILEYTLPSEGRVTLTIRNMTGQVVEVFVNNKMETEGVHTIRLEEYGVEAGLYLVTLKHKTADREMLRTIKLIKGH